jgi:hypothetical protein
LKSGGSGVPPPIGMSEASALPPVDISAIGDGGMGWKLRKLKRAKEQATEERSLEDVWRDRGGDLEELRQLQETSAKLDERKRDHRQDDRRGRWVLLFRSPLLHSFTLFT